MSDTNVILPQSAISSLSRLPLDCHVLSVGISVWTGLDLRRVTYGRDFNAQVSQKLSESPGHLARLPRALGVLLVTLC